MRRRTQQNGLLIRVFGLSLLFHAVMLPILAHLGTFPHLQSTLLVSQMVTLPPPQSEPQPEPEVKHPPEKKPPPPPKRPPDIRKTVPTQEAQKPAPRSPVPAQHVAASPPRIVAANAPRASGGATEPTVPQANGRAGAVPTAKGTPFLPPPVASSPSESPTAVATPEPTPVPTPTPPPPTPTPMPVPTPTPTSIFTQPVAIRTPDPDVPESLRQDALDKSTTVVIHISEDGVPTDVTVAESSGNRELDRIAVETAKRWRFKPATRDGQPVASKMRLQIEFQIS